MLPSLPEPLSDPTYFYCCAGILGLCIGSFLNVCIYRLPEKKSIVHPPSSCPECGSGIRFYDNIPVVSWLVLRGKCRSCQNPISIRYPFVELLTGAAALAAVWRFGFGLSGLIHFLFFAALIVITFIDIDHQIIPDEISLPGIPLLFAATFLLPTIGWKESLIGILFGGGSLYLVWLAYYLITRTEGMGFGDVKLLAMMGSLIGWQGVLFTIFFSSALGTVIGGGLMLIRRSGMKMKVPYGPFLAFGGVLYLLRGSEIILWYFGLYR